jgi:hypothetical protein
MIPRGITTFEADDEVLAVTDADGAASLLELFSVRENKVKVEEPARRRGLFGK